MYFFLSTLLYVFSLAFHFSYVFKKTRNDSRFNSKLVRKISLQFCFNSHRTHRFEEVSRVGSENFVMLKVLLRQKIMAAFCSFEGFANLLTPMTLIMMSSITVYGEEHESLDWSGSRCRSEVYRSVGFDISVKPLEASRSFKI